MDGVVLCHLANHIRPRSVASIHVPSPAVVSSVNRLPTFQRQYKFLKMSLNNARKQRVFNIN